MSESARQRPGLTRSETEGNELPVISGRVQTERGLGSSSRRPRRATEPGYLFKNPLPDGMELEIDARLADNPTNPLHRSVSSGNLDTVEAMSDQALKESQIKSRSPLSFNERLDQDGDDGQTVVITAPAIDKKAPDSGVKPVIVTFKK